MLKILVVRITTVVFLGFLIFTVILPQKIFAGSTCNGSWTCTKGSSNYTYNCASFNGMTESSCTGGGGSQGNYCQNGYQRSGGCSWSSGVAPTSPPAATSAPAPTNPPAATSAPAPTTATSGSLSCPPNNNYNYSCLSETECYSLKSAICSDSNGGKFCCNGKVDRSYCDGQKCGTTGEAASPTPASGIGTGDGDSGGVPTMTPFPTLTPNGSACTDNSNWSCSCSYGAATGQSGPATCAKYNCTTFSQANRIGCAAAPGVGTGGESPTTAPVGGGGSGSGPTLAPRCNGVDEINRGGTEEGNISCTCEHGEDSGNFGPAHCYNATSECSYGLSGLMRDCAATASEGTGGDEDAPDSDVPALGGAKGEPVVEPTSAPASCRSTCDPKGNKTAYCQSNDGIQTGNTCFCVMIDCGAYVWNCNDDSQAECKIVKGTPAPINSIPTWIPAEEADIGTGGVIPSLTAFPTLAQTCTAKPLLSVGNADNDCYVNWTDSALWTLEFAGVNSTKLADFNVDGKVNLADFEIWRRNASTFGN